MHFKMFSRLLCLQENVPVEFECPETSPAEVVSAIDQAPPQVPHQHTTDIA